MYNKDEENVSFKVIFKVLILNIIVVLYTRHKRSHTHYLPYVLPTLGLDCLVVYSGSAVPCDLEEVTLNALNLSFLIYKVVIKIILIPHRYKIYSYDNNRI